MLHTVQKSTMISPDFAASITDLTKSTLRNLILIVGGSYLIWYIMVTAIWAEMFGWRIRGITLVVIIPSVLSIWLLSKHLRVAQIIWQTSLIAAITMAVYLFQEPQIAFLYALLPFIAVITINWPAGLLVEGLILTIVIWLTYGSAGRPLSSIYGVVIVISGACAGLSGWAILHTLFTAMEWYAFSFVKAEENLESVREQRAKLLRTQKSLDEAYYRLRRANAALVAAWKAADEAERFKAEFVTNVSHELRTPLNLIVGFSEVIMTSPESYGGIHLPGPYRSDLNAIYHSAQHLLALVDDVIDLARIEVGKIAVARDEVDLAALVAEAAQMVSDYIETKGLELRLNIVPDLPSLWIDRLRIRQVLLNLLVNAARFTERGYISVDVARQEDEVVVRVTDTGQGIPAQDLPKIFEEFRSTEQPLSTWHSGTGLGLPISKKFVELNHGRMGVESTYLKGTSFWFTLPCKPVVVQQIGSHPRQRPQPVMRLGASERIVVVVHDDPQVAVLLQRYMDGYRVLNVANLAEGVAMAENIKALALITDSIQTPPSSLDSSLVIRCPLPSSLQAAVALGADNLLVKPITRQELLAAIERLGRPIRRVLVADDDPDVVRLFRRILRTRIPPQNCLEAYNGEEALQLIRKEKPDLILLDLIMPGRDGRSVLEEIAQDPGLEEVSIIIISAKGQDYVNLSLSGPIQISKPGGFQLGETVRVLEASFKMLAPGWHHLDPRGAEPAKGPAGSAVFSSKPLPPGSTPTAVH